jgi:uncharacterized protein
MKILQKICFVLLLTTFSSAYAGGCVDVHSCRVKAERGDAGAQYVLGYLYFKGRDYQQAFKWYTKAAEQGVAGAQFNLGVMYAGGEGVIKDFAMAHMYWNIAAVSGDKIAKKERDRIEGVMTASQIEKAQDLAREWIRTH